MNIEIKYNIGDIIRFYDMYDNTYYGAIIGITIDQSGEITYHTNALDNSNKMISVRCKDQNNFYRLSSNPVVGHDDNFNLKENNKVVGHDDNFILEENNK